MAGTGKNDKLFFSEPLRHDFCSKLVQKGADLYSAAGLAGQENMKTARRYAHLSPERLRSTIQKLNSGDNMSTMDENGIRQDVVSS
ncbi:MAG: hypothetical protein D8M57_13510 [Candidatus Scalindua sp. AMX11]|nr:MAG: hypothetical protein DWQ00_04950 [Candidatus Scalindua sp.]RZV72097.1 MAG: hypothetical protein EX341_14365 [Candidatus Scalindua sp. SCAELEC01]TDE64385.1 MAG: hypothetical protein D8M57_13510 [Candidatus Scalindua sp. AMX11]